MPSLFIVFMTLTVVVPLCMIIGGIFLALRASRTSTQHLCTTCGYDLRGLPTSVRCPECGNVLDGSNTIVPGQTITRSWQMTVGLALTLFGLIGLAIAVTTLMAILLFH